MSTKEELLVVVIGLESLLSRWLVARLEHIAQTIKSERTVYVLKVPSDTQLREYLKKYSPSAKIYLINLTDTPVSHLDDKDMRIDKYILVSSSESLLANGKDCVCSLVESIPQMHEQSAFVLGMPALVVRLSTVFWPGMTGNVFASIWHQIVISSTTLVPITIPSLRYTRMVLSLPDAVDGIIRVAFGGEVGEIYHVASHETTTVENFLTTIQYCLKTIRDQNIDFQIHETSPDATDVLLLNNKKLVNLHHWYQYYSIKGIFMRYFSTPHQIPQALLVANLN